MTNSWHERFKSDEYQYGKLPNEFVVEAAHWLPKQAKVLCIAEGEGRNAVYLAEQGFEVTAWDYAAAGLEKTKRLAIERGVEVETCLKDLAEVDWQQEEQQWDAIVHIFGHVSQPLFLRTWQGVQKALVLNGFYISELYTVNQLAYGTGGPPVKELLVNPLHLQEQFAQFFPQHVYIGEVERFEGKLHTGLAHVIQTAYKKQEN